MTRKRARTAAVVVIAVAAGTILMVVASCNEPGSDATEHALMLDQPGSGPSRGVSLHLSRVATRVERLRGLAFKSPPRVRVMSAAELAALGRRLKRGLARQTSRQPVRLRRTRRLEQARTGFQRLAGILPEQPASDATARGPIERIGGAYDYPRNRIILVQGEIETRRELQLVLAHELTHALEDQRFPLRLPASIGLTQKAQARRALIEGTATFVAARYASRYLTDQAPVKQRLAGQRSIFAAGGSTPYAVKAANIFDYVDGALFVRALHGRANGWSSVNRALRHAPTRSQQILHPRDWRRSPAARPVRLDLSHRLDAKWRLVGGGPAGEQDALAILGQGAFDVEANSGAAGWAGGGFEVWRARDDPTACESCEGGEVGVVGFSWRERLDAWQFARAFFAYMVLGRHGERIGPRSWHLSDGFASLRSTRRASAIAFAPTRKLARSVAWRAARQAAGRS